MAWTDVKQFYYTADQNKWWDEELSMHSQMSDAPISAQPKEYISTSNLGYHIPSVGDPQTMVGPYQVNVIHRAAMGEIVLPGRSPPTQSSWARDIMLYGIMLEDELPPFVEGENIFDTQGPRDYSVGDKKSGYPWSKEEVSVIITEYGVVPSFYVTYEHIMSLLPMQGEILEVKFINSSLGITPGQKETFTRYVWALFSRPGDMGTYGRWRTAIGGSPPSPHSNIVFDNCDYVLLDPATNPENVFVGGPDGVYLEPRSLGYSGSFVGCLQVDNFKLVVNNKRVAVVKTDMHIDFIAPDGTPIDTREGWWKLTVNKTFVFFRDKKYLIELKNIGTDYHKNVAEKLDIQWMQIKECDADWGFTGQYATDASFYPNAPAQSGRWLATVDSYAYKLGMQYWPGSYSLAICEADELTPGGIPPYEAPTQSEQVTDKPHTGYIGFYPNVSNWDVDFFSYARWPWPRPLVDWPGASNDLRNSHIDNMPNLIMGAWNFSMFPKEAKHVAQVEGFSEHQWNYTLQGPNVCAGPGPPEPRAEYNSMFEISWALNETFNPLFTLNRIGDEFSEGPIGSQGLPPSGYGYWWPFLCPGYTGPYPGGWPWWDAQNTAWTLPWRDNCYIFVVGDTIQGAHDASIAHWPASSAATMDNLAATDIMGGISWFWPGIWNPPPYRSSLDTEVTVVDPDTDDIAQHRWYYKWDGNVYIELPVKVSSLAPIVFNWPDQIGVTIATPMFPMGIDTITPWINIWEHYISEPPVYGLAPDGAFFGSYESQDPMNDKYKVWHVIATGGPDVNLDTNYFNDFAYSLYIWADQRDPADWAWGVPTWTRGYPDARCYLPVPSLPNGVSEDFIYTPASKRVYKDFKTNPDCYAPYEEDGVIVNWYDLNGDGIGDEHYFALVSLVMDHNITREYDIAYFQENMEPPMKLDDTVYPWAALLVQGIRGIGTIGAGQYVAHEYPGWGFLNTMNIQFPADPADLNWGWPGATAVVLEFIDLNQDGHIDILSVVEVVGTILSDKTIIPCVDWEARKWGRVMAIGAGGELIDTGYWIWETDYDRLPIGVTVETWKPIDCNPHTWPERPTITYERYFPF